MPALALRIRATPTPAYKLKMSATPSAEAAAPPTLGHHTAKVLGETLGLDAAAIERLYAAGMIG